MECAGAGISLLVPFRADDAGRAETWAWLLRYWSWALPGAEIIVEGGPEVPFSKTRAVNRAFKRSTGDVIVILDADAYMDPRAITDAAAACRLEKSWWTPYTGFWRIKRSPSARLLKSAAEQPMQLTLPPDPDIVQGGEAAWNHAYSLRNFGALCTVMPREAFEAVGGMDPRFAGWGGEDTSFAAALDTLWVKRSLATRYDAAHLWHARIGEGTGRLGRMHAGQENPGAGSQLKNDYLRAVGKPRAMRSIVDEGLNGY